MLKILSERPTDKEILYLFLLVILTGTLLVFIIETPSIDKAALELCNYSYDGTDIRHNYNIEDNWRLPNATIPKDNSQDTQKPSPQMRQEPT